ncbi:MAG: DegT/DnrJ/EryC1/StrS family aminotransferase [Spirochaetales bacterium]|uniref:DegT/DnrJ/EryC1/StrS family aminotransferase n=1 Tax=Candidatus Thalassospirochaeta sargassi TaxID=3119039 RepID=A0AAJ1IFT8_9SPIO|nr:DegT/DnrJ/EryC1/StrS family aminotransferase [Spirochaetales bacterium]
MNISVFKPSIKRREMDAVLNCMVSDRIGFGKSASQLVKDLSDFLGLKGGHAFKEYYRAIKTAVEALGLEPGDSVIVSALAPQLYIMVLKDLGLEPLIADVDPDSSLIDIELVESAAEDAKAIIVNYEMGFVPDIARIAETGLAVIEDISMALGASIDEQKAGSFGRFTVINMDEDGLITTGGGAAVLASSRKDVRALNAVAGNLHQSVFLPDMNASLGIVQLKNITEYLESRLEIADIFTKSLMRSRHKKLTQKGDAMNVYYSFPVVLDTGIHEVSAYARKKNILTETSFSGSIAAYSEEVQASCPNAKKLLLRCINFPLYPMLGKSNISIISRVLSSLP